MCFSHAARLGLPYMLERAGLDVQQGTYYILIKKNIFMPYGGTYLRLVEICILKSFYKYCANSDYQLFNN